MPRALSVNRRLSAMMFLHYGGLGAWIVPLARWLGSEPSRGGLGFSPQDIAAVYSVFALGALTAPLLTGLLADRSFATEKLIGVLNALMALVCAAAGVWAQTHSGSAADPARAFSPFFALLLIYSAAIMIALTSGTAMTMRALVDPTHQFGRIRLVGTFGWIVTNAIVGFVLDPLSAEPLYLGAACHGLLVLLAPSLPHTPPLGRGRPIAEVIGLPAIRLFRDRSFVVFVLVAFIAFTMQCFYTVFGNDCCAKLGLWRPEVVMTSAQFVEMACLAAIPFMVRSVGLKATLLLGLLAWAVRCALFATEHRDLVAWIAVPLQGVAFPWFTVVGSLYIDREAPNHLRAGAQGLMTFVTSGPGTLLGNYLAGQVVAANTVEGRTDWTAVWLLPTAGCVLAAALFAIGFRAPRKS